MKMPPKISIITSTFNAADALPATARSLGDQSCRDFEWIIVDGASSDDTMQVARSFGSLVSVLICGPDRGVYDAWNKALPHVSGEWVYFLGAGDEFFENDTLEHVISSLDKLGPEMTIAYGKVIEIEEGTGVTKRLRDHTWIGLDGRWMLARPSLPPHQGTFHRSTLFAAGFKFDARCKISADTELMLREFIENRGVNIDLMVASVLLGGISHRRTNRLRLIAESIYINVKVGIFFRRPFYQLAVLASNLVKHIPRLFGFTKI